MGKKRLLVISSGALVLLLLVGLAGGTLVFAQDTEPATSQPGPGGRGDMLGRGGSWAQFDVAAEALGLTPNELFVELHDAGKTLTEIAEEKGVDITAVQEALNASRTEAQRQAIEQAVADGTMSQEQADWLLEGLEKGFTGGMHGLGPGRFGPSGAPPDGSQ
jgi:uncharacterized membrane protein